MSKAQNAKEGATARLKVRISDGVCSLPDGSALPQLKPGTLAELVVASSSFVNEEERTWLLTEHPVEFLPKGASVFARIDDRWTPDYLVKFCLHVRHWPGKLGSFVEIRLGSDLQLLVRGDGRSVLAECECTIPALSDAPCSSLNEAYSRVSAAFEPKRRSHTGNIFDCAFHDEKGVRKPLSTLRNDCVAEFQKRRAA